MIEIFGLSFSLPGFALFIYLLLVMITQISWWMFKYPWPNHAFVTSIQKNFKDWKSRVDTLWDKFKAPTVFGPLATVMILVILPLNVTLLALVFELIIPPGDRIPIPLIGSYGVFTLIAGALFGLVQIAFGLVRHMIKKNNEKLEKPESTFTITSLLVVTIVFEVGMSVWRALLLTSGEEPISPTFWDQATLFLGPALSGLIGLVVPMADVILGRFAFFDFIEPVVKDIALSVRISVSYIGLGIIGSLFCFFKAPKPPPPVGINVTTYKDDFQNLSNSITRAAKDVKKMVCRLKRLFRILNLLGEYESENNTLLKKVEGIQQSPNEKNMRIKTDQILGGFKEKSKEISGKMDLYDIFASVKDSMIYDLNELSNIAYDLENAQKSCKKLKSKQNRLKKRLVKSNINNTINLNNSLSKNFQVMENNLNDLDNIYQTFSNNDKKFLGASYNPNQLKNRIDIEKAKIVNQKNDDDDGDNSMNSLVNELQKINNFNLQQINDLQSVINKLGNNVELINNSILNDWIITRMQLLKRAKEILSVYGYIYYLLKYKKRI